MIFLPKNDVSLIIYHISNLDTLYGMVWYSRV